VTVAAPTGIGDVSGTSAVTVTGAGSVLTVNNELAIGSFCGCLSGTLTVANGAVVNATGFVGIGPGSTLNLGNGGLAGSFNAPAIENRGQIVANFTDTTTLAANISGIGSLTKTGSGTLSLTGNNSYSGGTTITGGLINFAAAGNFGTGTITLNGGGLQWASGNTTDISSRLAPLGPGGATFNTNGNAVTFATPLTGSGGLVKAGAGGLVLLGDSTYTGGTVVNSGILHIGEQGSAPGSIVIVHSWVPGKRSSPSRCITRGCSPVTRYTRAIAAG